MILLVECDFVSRLFCANELLDEGYEVIESDNAIEARNMLSGRNDFDAIVADIDLTRAPGGLALVNYVYRHFPDVKILVHSAWVQGQAESEAMAADFLLKPHPAGALGHRMLSLLTSRPPTPTNFAALRADLSD